MEFKLKYGNNFSLVNGLQTFTITDTIKEGTIEVETIGNDSGIQITGYQFLISYNGQVLYPAPPSQNSSITFDFENFEGNWSIVARVFVQEQSGPDSTGEEIYEVPGNWKVIDSSGTGTGTGTGGGGASTIPNKLYQRFVSKIVDVDVEQGIITTKDNLSDKLNDELSPKTFDQSMNWAIKYDNFDYKKLNTLIDFGNNQKAIIVNSQTDVDSVKIAPHSVVLKTYNEVPDNIQVKQNVHIVQEMSEPIRETIRLYPFEDAELGDPILRQPTEQSIDYINNSKTGQRSQEDIYTDNNFLSGSLFNELQSGSKSVEINVDYNEYKNFSTFGSVEKRLQNFRTKLQQYEAYSLESASFAVKATTTSSVYDSAIAKNEELKNGILNNFDHYEKYLYYQSSSAESSSFGLQFDNSWPKTNSSKPYTLADVTASAATTWYNNNITSASLYDQNNPNRLVNLIPEHIIRDSENQPFVDFLDMVGHYFDNFLIYIKAFEDTYDRREKLTEGLSKDLVWTISDAFGWKQPSGKELVELHRYIKGYQLSGSATSSTYEVYSEESEKDIEREIWGRVLSSMPYILKRKGTKESIEALVNSYGIPPTILRINEYGGPDVKEYQPTFDIRQRFTRALDFTNSQYIQTQWKETSGSLRTPDTIEFRFRAASSSNQVLVAKDQRFAVRLIDEGSTTDNKGKVEFLISSSLGTASVTSSLFPVFNNEFWSVGITREKSAGYDFTTDRTIEYNTTESLQYNLFVKQYEAGRSKILYDSSTSMTLSGSTASTGLTSSLQNGQWTASGDVFFGSTGSFGDLGVEFTGSLQEIRYFNAPLTESAFNNHTAAPKAINGNHASASFTDLVFRLRLDDNKNLSTSSDLMNTAPDRITFSQTSSAYQSGSAVGFSANTFSNIEQEEKALTPNVGQKLSNSKVRIEQNWIPSGSGLSVDYRTEESSYDTAPIDSNKVGVFFSPTDVINRDIIESLADIDFDQEIGDPRDEQELFYRGLRKLSDSFFQKYKGTNNFWDYMRLIKYYDQAIFEQIKKVIPARTKFNFGVVVEPTILERPKEILHKGTSVELVNKTGEINISQTEATQSFRRPVLSITSSRDDYSGVLSESFSREPSLYLVASSSLSASFNRLTRYRDSFVRSYSTGSITQGVKVPDVLFNEVLSPFISSSRESERFETRDIFYTSSAAVGEAGTTSLSKTIYAPFSSSALHAYSSSFKKAEYQPPSDYLSGYRRSQFEGVKNTINTTTDGELPVIVGASSPTAVISKQSGEGKKLEVIRKK
tara:strand:- start:140 stop:3964 length:3825 start_codon:yes stop_codon:yes gene_type:complete